MQVQGVQGKVRVQPWAGARGVKCARVCVRDARAGVNDVRGARVGEGYKGRCKGYEGRCQGCEGRCKGCKGR